MNKCLNLILFFNEMFILLITLFILRIKYVICKIVIDEVGSILLQLFSWPSSVVFYF